MSFRKFLPLVAVAASLFALPARAQFGAYATITGERVTGFQCQATNGPCASNDGSVRPFGSNFGVYYDFRNIGPVRIGADLRGGVMTANKSATEYQSGSGLVRHYDALAGIRGSIGTPIRILRPYAEIAGGYAKSNAASLDTTVYANYTQVQGLVGVDVAITPFFDIRAIELGAGALFGTGTHSTQSIGAGLVFHFPR